MVEIMPRNRWFLWVVLVAAVMLTGACGSDSSIGVTLPKETPIPTVSPPSGEQQRSHPTPTATPLDGEGVSALPVNSWKIV